jgi:hypothetical protein
MYWADTETLEPVFEIPTKDGKGMTNRIPPHRAKDMDLIPRVTGIIGDMLGEGFGLRRYKENLLIHTASGNVQGNDEHDEDYVSRILEEAYSGAKEARDRGKEVHASIDAFLRGEAVVDDPAASEAIAELTQFLETVDAKDIVAERTLGGYEAGYSGTPDIAIGSANLGDVLSYCGRSPYLEGQGTVIVDLKTTNLRKFKKPYREWRYQFGGYDRLLDGSGTRLFVSWVVDPFTAESKWICYDDVDRWRSAFDGIWNAWRKENDW